MAPCRGTSRSRPSAEPRRRTAGCGGWGCCRRPRPWAAVRPAGRRVAGHGVPGGREEDLVQELRHEGLEPQERELSAHYPGRDQVGAVHAVDSENIDQKRLTEHVKTSFACGRACTARVDACLAESTVAKSTACVRMHVNGATISTTAGKELCRHTSYDVDLTPSLLKAGRPRTRCAVTSAPRGLPSLRDHSRGSCVDNRRSFRHRSCARSSGDVAQAARRSGSRCSHTTSVPSWTAMGHRPRTCGSSG